MEDEICNQKMGLCLAFLSSPSCETYGHAWICVMEAKKAIWWCIEMSLRIAKRWAREEVTGSFYAG